MIITVKIEIIKKVLKISLNALLCLYLCNIVLRYKPKLFRVSNRSDCFTFYFKNPYSFWRNRENLKIIILTLIF